MPSPAAALFDPVLQALAQSQADAGRHVAARGPVAGLVAAGGVFLLEVGQVHVVTGDPDLDAPLGQLGRQLGGHVGEKVQDAAGHRTAQQFGDALCDLGHGVVAELADADHVRTQALHDQ